jgi:hypothetical protein
LVIVIIANPIAVAPCWENPSARGKMAAGAIHVCTGLSNIYDVRSSDTYMEQTLYLVSPALF